MTKFANLAYKLHNDESGAALLEYTVLLGILAVAVITVITTIGTETLAKWTAFNAVYN